MVFGFDSDVAREYGVNEAIVIANFQFWILKNKANGRHLYDGRYWTYNSAKALSVVFPFWSDKQVRRIVDGLVEKGVLIKGNYNPSAYDRTLWYAFKDEDKWIGKDDVLDFPKSENGINDIGNPIPDSNTDNNTDSMYIHSSKKGYGEFGNVKLSDEEYRKLESLYDRKLKMAIDILDGYIANKKKDPYKNHYAVMREGNWVWQECEKREFIPDGPISFEEAKRREQRLKEEGKL